MKSSKKPASHGEKGGRAKDKNGRRDKGPPKGKSKKKGRKESVDPPLTEQSVSGEPHKKKQTEFAKKRGKKEEIPSPEIMAGAKHLRGRAQEREKKRTSKQIILFDTPDH